MDYVQVIRAAVEAGQYVVGAHARQSLQRRKVALWQIEAGLKQGTVRQVRPTSRPNPSIVVEQLLADGTSVRVIWSWLRLTSRAKLVTVFFPFKGAS